MLCYTGGCSGLPRHDIHVSTLCNCAPRSGSGALAKRSARQLPACPAAAHHGHLPALVNTQNPLFLTEPPCAYYQFLTWRMASQSVR